MRIFLIGFMGSGKTTSGKRLAKKLNYSFIDTDSLFEEKSGISISDFFIEKGEMAFRQAEHALLDDLVKLDNVVVATGGGLPCFFNNMDIINANGVSIYLRLSPLSLASRLANSKEDRPLIKNLSGDDLLSFITEMLEKREPYYLKAKCVIKGESVKTDHLINLVFG